MSRDNRDIDTERVIAEVKLRSCLWDSNHPNRKEMRAAAWDEVAMSILGDVSDEYEKDSLLKTIQQRWKTARDAFFRTKSYLKNGDPGKKFKKYIYYDELSFLSPNDANYDLGETETQNQEAEEATETQIKSANVLKPVLRKRRNRRGEAKSQTKIDPLADSHLQNEPQKENEFAKELLRLLSSQESNISSDDLFFFMSMGPVLNTFDIRQKLEFRSKVLDVAADIHNMYNRNRSVSSILETDGSPEDVKPKVEVLDASEYEIRNQSDDFSDSVIVN